MTLLEYKHKFISKHNKGDWHVDTSPMDAYGGYTKTYIFSDGAMLYEVNRPIYEVATAEVEVHGIPVAIQSGVKLLETEVWHTDDANSQKFYERW